MFMDKPQRQNVGLPADQQAIGDRCFHPTGIFVEFPEAEIEQSIPQRFEKTVRRFPHAIAVKVLDQSVTYVQLNAAANRVAHSLLGRCGAKEEPVALLLSKGVSLVIAVFGVLKAGKAYILLDPSHPLARSRFILDHAKVSVAITDTQHRGLADDLVRP